MARNDLKMNIDIGPVGDLVDLVKLTKMRACVADKCAHNRIRYGEMGCNLKFIEIDPKGGCFHFCERTEKE